MRSTEVSFLRILRRYLAPHHVPAGIPDDRCFAFSADCGIDKALAGGKMARGVKSLYLATLRVYRGRDPEEMAGRLVALARDLAFNDQHEFVLARAGGVVVDGAGVVLPSPPQPRLPALVAELVLGGAAYAGDEMVRLDPVHRAVHGIDLPLLVDVSEDELFARLGRERPRRRRGSQPGQAMTDRRPVGLDELAGTRAPESFAPDWIVLPYFEPGTETRLEPMGGAEALFRFVEAGINLHVWGDRAILLMRMMLESSAVSRLVVGDVAEAAALVAGSVPVRI